MTCVIGLVVLSVLILIGIGFLFPILFIPAMVFLAIGLFVFWVCMLISAIQNKGLTDNERLIWILVIIFTGCIGPILYFFIGRPKRLGPPANRV